MIEFGPCLAPSLPGNHLVGIRSAAGTRSAVLDHLNRARVHGKYLSLRAGVDRQHAANLAYIHRNGGALPRELHSKCHDAYTLVAEREVEELDALGEALDRALRHRRELGRRG